MARSEKTYLIGMSSNDSTWAKPFKGIVANEQEPRDTPQDTHGPYTQRMNIYSEEQGFENIWLLRTRFEELNKEIACISVWIREKQMKWLWRHDFDDGDKEGRGERHEMGSEPEP